MAIRLACTRAHPHRLLARLAACWLLALPAPLWAATTQTPWQTNAYGTLSTNIAWNFAMGYHFTPLVNGQVTALGGYFNGTKTVKLFNKATGAVLATATVSAANTWAYTNITPVNVTAGTTYTVAVYLAGAGGSYRNSLSPVLPRIFGDIRIEGSTYISTASSSTARPTNTLSAYMYGQTDIQFIPATADTTPPTGSVTINSGATATKSTTVTLTLSATDNAGAVSQMQFSDDGTTYSTPEAYTTTKAWPLPNDSDGLYTLYARFKDAVGNWSAAATDSITLDLTAPTISAVSASGITVSAATITWTTNEAATTQVDYGTTTAYGQSSALNATLVTSHSVALSGLSASTLYHYRARSKDAVGNSAISADVTLTTASPGDTTPPSGTVTINGGAAATNNVAVTLTLSATDNAGAVSQMQFSNDGTTYSAAEAYTTSKTWTLSSGDGTKTVRVKFKDAAGNWSATATDSITLDTTPPSVNITSPLDGAVIVAPTP